MSANDDEEMEIPGREVAYRLFAAEYDDASVSYTESDEERAPNYVIAPTGARINRLFAVGTLTEVTAVNDEMVRARVVDPTGAFVVYAGQYQPDELAFLEGIEPPAFVAVTGKARTFQPEDSDQVYTSIRPESIATVDADTRDRWVVSAAEQTLERIELYAAAAEADVRGDELTDALLEQGVEPGLAAGIPLAQDHYGTTPSYLAALRDCALDAVEVVSGDLDQVGPFDAGPGEPNAGYEDATFDSLTDLGVDAVDLSALEAVSTESAAEQEPAVEAAAEPESESEPEPEAVAATAGGDTVESSSAAGTATGDARDDSTEGATEADIESDADDAGVELESESVEGTVEAEAASGAEPEPASEPEPAVDAESESDAAAESDLETDATDAVDEGADEDLGDFDAEDIGDGMYEMDDEEREQLEEEFGAEFTTGAEVEEPGEAGIDVPEPDEADADAEADSDLEADTGATDTDADTEAAVDDDLGAPPTSGLEDEARESDVETDAEPDAESEATEDESVEETAAEPDEPESEPEAASATDDSADDSEDEDEAADEAADGEPAEDVDLEDYVVETMAELDDGDGADRGELVETVAADTGASADEVEDAIQDALMGGQCYEPDDETLKPI
ncbi:RPA family protein [Halopiger thermotolerans]